MIKNKILILWISIFNYTLCEIKTLKIGLKNEEIEFRDNCVIYEVRTNYRHLQINLTNFNNIKESQISDKIKNGNCSPNKCSTRSNLCQGNKL